MAFRVFDPASVFTRLERGAALREAELHVFAVGGMRQAYFFARQPRPKRA